MSAGIDRRGVLKGLGGSAALGALGSGLIAGGGCREGASLEDALASCVADPAAAGAVGTAVLEIHGSARPGARALVRALAADAHDDWQARAAQGSGRLFEAVRAQHFADFADGRVLIVQGWVLSQTEARLAALVARRAERDG